MLSYLGFCKSQMKAENKECLETTMQYPKFYVNYKCIPKHLPWFPRPNFNRQGSKATLSGGVAFVWKNLNLVPNLHAYFQIHPKHIKFIDEVLRDYSPVRIRYFCQFLLMFLFDVHVACCMQQTRHRFEKTKKLMNITLELDREFFKTLFDLDKYIQIKHRALSA